MSANLQTRSTGLWIGLAIGGPLVAFGTAGAIADSSQTHPTEFARWIVGAAVVHDLAFAPLVLGAFWVLARVSKRRTPPSVRWAFATTVVLVLFAWPLVAGYGRNPTVPSLLPRNYASGLVAYLLGVWLAAAIGLAPRLRRLRR